MIFVSFDFGELLVGVENHSFGIEEGVANQKADLQIGLEFLHTKVVCLTGGGSLIFKRLSEPEWRTLSFTVKFLLRSCRAFRLINFQMIQPHRKHLHVTIATDAKAFIRRANAFLSWNSNARKAARFFSHITFRRENISRISSIFFLCYFYTLSWLTLVNPVK